MPLPKRAAPYIVILLLVLLLVLVVWMFQAVSSPQLKRAIRERRTEPSDSPSALEAGRGPRAP